MMLVVGRNRRVVKNRNEARAVYMNRFAGSTARGQVYDHKDRMIGELHTDGRWVEAP